jgi:hypothetical protein
MILRVVRKPLQAGAIVFGLAAVLAAPQAAGEQNLGTIGTGTAGESTATRAGGTPTGLLEYSCEENDKSLWEGRITLWLPPGTSQPRK